LLSIVGWKCLRTSFLGCSTILLDIVFMYTDDLY
jgi:hypothetical protein